MDFVCSGRDTCDGCPDCQPGLFTWGIWCHYGWHFWTSEHRPSIEGKRSKWRRENPTREAEIRPFRVRVTVVKPTDLRVGPEELAEKKLAMALTALDNASAGIPHVADGWCGHCYTKAWAERVRALT